MKNYYKKPLLFFFIEDISSRKRKIPAEIPGKFDPCFWLRKEFVENLF